MSSILEQGSQLLNYRTPNGESNSTALDVHHPFAEEFTENRSQRERLFHLANAVYHNPDDIGLLQEYASLIISTSGRYGKASPSEVLDVCDQVEGLLLDQARRADSEYLQEILALADDLDTIREMALAEDVSANADRQQAPATEDDHILQRVRSWEEYGIPEDVPGAIQKVKQALDEAGEVHAAIESEGGSTLNGLDAWITRLEATVEVHYLLNDADARIEAALSEDETTEAAYLLQSAERTIQQLVMLRSEVDDAWRSKVHTITRRLEEASQSIAERKTLRTDQHHWDTFEQKHSNTANLLSENLPTVPDSVNRGYSKFTSRIEDRETVLRALNHMLSQLQTQNFQQKAVETIEQLSDQLDKLQTRRQQAYNKYALHYVAKALEAGVEQTGVLGDSKILAKVMIKHLGKIDRMYLTEEVNRAYSEVFELLFGNLKKAKSQEDFDEPGRKLHMLKRMAEKEATHINSF